MIFDGYVHQIPDIDPDETAEWLDSLDAVVDVRGKTRARYLLTKLLERAQETPGQLPRHRLHPLRQHHPARAGAVVPRRRAHRAPHPGLRPLERGDDGRQGQQARRRHRRPPLDVRLVGLAVRDRLQPLLPRQGRRQPRRRRVLPGPRRPRRLRPGVHGGPPQRRRPRPLPARDRTRRPRPVELPAPPPDARLLGVPDGVDGPRPDHRAVPRPVQPLPPEPPDRRHQPEPRVVLHGRRRVRRAGVARRHHAWPRASSSTT